jgi:hypothetical protein
LNLLLPKEHFVSPVSYTLSPFTSLNTLPDKVREQSVEQDDTFSPASQTPFPQLQFKFEEQLEKPQPETN